MSEHYFSSSNGSLLHPNPFIVNKNFSFEICATSRPESVIFTTYLITNIALLLPLCIHILCPGFLKCRQHHSTSTVAFTSHSDSFIVHVVTMELIGVLGCTLICCGIYCVHTNLLLVGFCLWTFTWYGQIFFQVLTCVKHYLAVVHPVTYLSLRSEKGVRNRNICIGCVWLLCFGGAGLASYVTSYASSILYFCLLSFSLIIISFCSIAVLCVLTRARPGEQGGDQERVDKSKQRAFHTILAILGLLSFKSLCGQILITLFVLSVKKCIFMAVGVWLNLPSSLLLPLMHLHKARV